MLSNTVFKKGNNYIKNYTQCIDNLRQDVAQPARGILRRIFFIQEMEEMSVKMGRAYRVGRTT